LKDLDPPFPDIRDEQGLEVFCNYAVTPWLVIGADVQFIRPGIGHHNAIFTGLRTVIKF
jgi:porin